MNILIDIGHPAHVHLFKHFTWQMEKKGHRILFTTRDKEVTIQLLEFYKFKFVSFGKHYETKIGKIWGLIKFDFLLLKNALMFKPDIFISHGSIYAAHVSFLLKKSHISLEDTGNNEQVRLYKPFTKIILTSDFFHKNYGNKQVKYKGYHELAYLHPNHFTPSPSILDVLGIKNNEKYVIFRFVSLTASHEIGHKGFSPGMKKRFIKGLSQYARIFVSSESSLPDDLKKYQIKISPEKMHDALAYANLYIGDSPTMAEESAVLGIPSICISTWAGDTGVINDLRKYNLLYCYKPEHESKAMEKSVELIKDENIKKKWEKSRQKMLSEKIDVTAFMAWFFEKYPESVRLMRENPDYQKRFK